MEGAYHAGMKYLRVQTPQIHLLPKYRAQSIVYHKRVTFVPPNSPLGTGHSTPSPAFCRIQGFLASWQVDLLPVRASAALSAE